MVDLDGGFDFDELTYSNLNSISPNENSEEHEKSSKSQSSTVEKKRKYFGR